ncbi:hypothetical protein HMI59_23150 (plasmid) [Paenarthrobacter sp. YJN-5]|nr:hypothetical protein HMI59_23150 [Paenarthrobacter sp. YJN-5]
MTSLLMAVALAMLAAARIPASRRKGSDTVFFAAVFASLSAVLIYPPIYIPLDGLLGGTNVVKLVLQSLMVLGLWFLRTAIIDAVSPETSSSQRTSLHRIPLFLALAAQTVTFILSAPTRTTTQWSDDYGAELMPALFSLTVDWYVAWVCAEIAYTCLRFIPRMSGTFRRSFTLVGTGCGIGAITMFVMGVEALSLATTVIPTFNLRDTATYKLLELTSIALVGIGLTLTSIIGRRDRLRIARWEVDTLKQIRPIHDRALGCVGKNRALRADETAPAQDRLHRMVVEIWDAELAAGSSSVLTAEERDYILSVERRLDLEHSH